MLASTRFTMSASAEAQIIAWFATSSGAIIREHTFEERFVIHVGPKAIEIFSATSGVWRPLPPRVPLNTCAASSIVRRRCYGICV